MCLVIPALLTELLGASLYVSIALLTEWPAVFTKACKITLLSKLKLAVQPRAW